MNRAIRRRAALKVVNDHIKQRQVARAKTDQYGIGFVISNKLILFTFGKWTWIAMDRRNK